MGHRVELGEIEAAAMRCDDVSRACCIFDAEKQRLHLFYTGSCEKATLLTALKADCRPLCSPTRFSSWTNCHEQKRQDRPNGAGRPDEKRSTQMTDATLPEPLYRRLRHADLRL